MSGQSIKILFEKLKEVKIEPGYVGFKLVGNLITKVVPHTQAYRAGICAGWRVVAVNGMPQPCNHISILKAIKKLHENYEPALILLQKASETNSYKHTITFSPGLPGFVAETGTNLINWVDPSGQAYQSGVSEGWRINKINGKTIKNDGSNFRKKFSEVIQNQKTYTCLFENPFVQTITFYPGLPGFTAKNGTNLINWIDINGQASKAGVRIGWRLCKYNEKEIDGSNFREFFVKAMKAINAYQFQFKIDVFENF